MQQQHNHVKKMIVLLLNIIIFIMIGSNTIHANINIHTNNINKNIIKSTSKTISSISVVQSSYYTGDRLKLLNKPIEWVSNNNMKPNLKTFKIDSSIKYQSIIGFGCALTEAAAFTFATMNEQIRNEILSLYWTSKGLNYTTARIHMNSCDFSLDNYSCDDVENDFQLNNFNIRRDKIFTLPLIKRVLNQVKVNYPKNGESFKIFLSPWSPPAWMKYNHEMNGSNQPNGLINSTNILDSWALHFSKFVTAYKNEGVDRIWGLTVQNEPEFAAPWDACCYTPEYQRDFIKNHLGPRMRRDHPNLKIMIYDHNRDHVEKWASTIYSDPEASKYVDGMAFHWYVDGEYENLSRAYQVNQDKFLLASEACWDRGVSYSNWTRGEKYGYDIINDLNNYASGWTDWNCILDWKGGPNHLENWCDAPIIADNRTQEIHIQPTYYFMGHFSKYLTQDSRRVHLFRPSMNDETLITSFQTPDNKIITIVQNQQESVLSFNLIDQDNHLYHAQIDVPPRTIRTLIYQK